MSTVHEWLSVRGERDLCLQYTNDYQQEVRGIYVYSTVHEWLSVRGEMDLCLRLQYTNDYQ